MSESNLMFEQFSQEEQVKHMRMYILDYVVNHQPDIADNLMTAITNSGELLSVMIEGFSAYLIDRTRRLNHEAGELFRMTAKTTAGIDKLVSNAGLTRGIKSPATSSTDAVLESNDDLLKRYDLSHYQANTTGTRYGYKYHALCYGLNDRPAIEITRLGNRITQTFTYMQSEPSNVSDVEFRRDAGVLDGDGREIGTGRVTGAVTPLKDKTVDLKSMLTYMKRPDIAQETDILLLKMATPRTYSVTINAYTNNDPRHIVYKSDIESQAIKLTDDKRHNEARITDHDFSYIAKDLGAYDVDVIGIEQGVFCDWDEYAECLELTINVLGKR